jgi:hypothetical protein
MQYSSIAEIAADEDLGLGPVEPTANAVRRAIDNRLRLLQPETTEHTSVLFRQLVAARVAIDELESADKKGEDAQLVPITTAALERMLSAIARPTQPTEAARSQVNERMQSSRAVAITKASRDFRNYRKLPLAGLSAIAAAIWATRQAFGANLTHIGTIVWSSAAGGFILIAILFLAGLSRIQGEDEEILRRLYDPDVQVDALIFLKRWEFKGPFTRNDIRLAIWYESAHRSVPQDGWRDVWVIRRWRISRGRRYRPTFERNERMLQSYRRNVRRGGRNWALALASTTDFIGALDDAAELSITRFIEIGLLEIQRIGGKDRFKMK